jgi:hypothetical protein
VELIGPYLVACVLLVAAGMAKVVRPDDTARAVARLVPWPLVRLRILIRVGALVEVAVGTVALVIPRPVSAALVAASYVLFAAVVGLTRARGGPIASCGCFGRPDTPATGLHLVVNLGLAAAAVVVTAAAPTTGSIASVLSHQPWNGVPLVAVSAVGAWLTFLVLSPLAALQGARRMVGATEGRWG